MSASLNFGTKLLFFIIYFRLFNQWYIYWNPNINKLISSHIKGQMKIFSSTDTFLIIYFKNHNPNESAYFLLFSLISALFPIFIQIFFFSFQHMGSPRYEAMQAFDRVDLSGINRQCGHHFSSTQNSTFFLFTYMFAGEFEFTPYIFTSSFFWIRHSNLCCFLCCFCSFTVYSPKQSLVWQLRDFAH